MKSLTAPDPTLGEQWTLTRGGWSVTLHWAGTVLRASIATVGREGELPADEAEAAWMDKAAAVVGVARGWDPVWEIPPITVPAFVEALGIERRYRQFHLKAFDDAVLTDLGASWHMGAYWEMSGGHVQIDVDATGFVWIRGAGRFADELAPLAGIAIRPDMPADNGTVDPSRAKEIARQLFTWQADRITWVMVND